LPILHNGEGKFLQFHGKFPVVSFQLTVISCWLLVSSFEKIGIGIGRRNIGITGKTNGIGAEKVGIDGILTGFI
jgi:hypothetical protein